MIEFLELIEKAGIFLLFLAPLIFFHELGHFIFARLCGVRVETFSLGFGPKLLKWDWKGTTYAVSLIPFGGYVKMFGDDPLRSDELTEAEKKEAFNHKSKFRRFLIVFGGPLANFIMAYVLYYFLVFGGEKVPQIRFGVVSEKSEYFSKGLRTGDILKQLNNRAVIGAYELNLADDFIKTATVESSQGVEKQIIVEKDLKNFLGDLSQLSGPLRSPVLVNKQGQFFALSESENQYAPPSLSLEDFRNSEGPLYLHFLNVSDPSYIEFEEPPKKPGKLVSNERLAELMPADLRISKVVEGSVAEKANLKPGDVIGTLNGERTNSFVEFSQGLQTAAKEGPVSLVVWRKGKEISLEVTPEQKEINGESRYLLGVYGGPLLLAPQMVETNGHGFFESFGRALGRTWQAFAGTASGIKKLITNEYSIGNIGGVLIIGKVANDSLDVSISYFLKLMAIMSINLGLLNLLPIPVLDGGHILFLILEAINRGPVSRKKMEIAQQFGLSLLLLLMVLALYNDITRLF